MANDDVVWCKVCDAFYAESRIDVLGHLQEEHTLSERLEALLYEGQRPEDVAADGGAPANETEDGGSKPIVYLAGPVAAYQDGGAAWRDRIIDEFGDQFEFRNPLDKYNVPVEDLTIVDGAGTTKDDVVSVTELVEADKALLEESDGVLVGYSAVQSVGTPMEVMWAYERDMPVAVWLRDDTGYDELSPWYRYHASAVANEVESALWHSGRHVEPGKEVRR